jgi:hypothetical protein
VLLCRETLEVETHLRKAQADYLALERSPIRSAVAERFKESCSDSPDFLTDVFAHIADPHAKRDLRIQGGLELLETGRVAEPSWVYQGKVNVAVKRREWAKIKSGSVSIPRTVFDLGVTSSLAGYRLTKTLKTAMEAALVVGGDMYQFCSTPSFDALTNAFDSLIAPLNRSSFIYFSDDACWSFVGPGGEVHMYNVDISKCDISHTEALFNELQALTPHDVKDNMRRLIEQLRSGITIRAPEDPEIKFTLRRSDGSPVLLSGSTLTTLINNLANILIGECLNKASRAGILHEAGLIEAVAQSGYVITLTRCHQVEHLQFLKHSPIMTTEGCYKPCINYGVALRASGFCHGDLPGRGDIEVRARSFQKQLWHGMFPYCSSPFIDALKATVADATSLGERADAQVRRMVESKHADHTPRATTVFLDSSHARRYDITESTLTSLTYTCQEVGFGCCIDEPASRAILALDYGVVFDSDL